LGSRLRRASTALAVLLVAAVTVVGGLQLSRFAMDVARLVSPQQSDRNGAVAPPAIVSRLSDWRATPGVGAKAKELLAADPRVTKSKARRLLDITDAIAENPMAGRLWLAYASQVLGSGYAINSALGALKMSQIVERRRAATMLSRALIVVGAWERIPNDMREASISELADLRRNLGGDDRAAVAQVAATKSPEVRAEIGGMLRPKLGEDVWVAKAMGF
jgi:hypothetical protein